MARPDWMAGGLHRLTRHFACDACRGTTARGNGQTGANHECRHLQTHCGIRIRIADWPLTLRSESRKRNFTAMRFHAETNGGGKAFIPPSVATAVQRAQNPKRDSEWGKKVLIDRRVNNGFRAADIRWAFTDQRQQSWGLVLMLVFECSECRGRFGFSAR